MAKGWRQSDSLVLIEIGGNDLLMGVSSSEYGRALDALLSKVVAPNRTVVMFELPLLPNKIAYGQIQRRLSAKYGVLLVPERYLAEVIGDANATTDGLHLSASGARSHGGASGASFVATLEGVSVPVEPCRRVTMTLANECPRMLAPFVRLFRRNQRIGIVSGLNSFTAVKRRSICSAAGPRELTDTRLGPPQSKT